MHKRMLPHGDYDHMGEAINLVNNFKNENDNSNVIYTELDGYKFIFMGDVEVEIGIDPKIQHRGLGAVVINRFYDELFSTGVASVTSSVFEFNNPSMRLHEKVAELNGIRLESYYINGKLWDMNIYSKTNSIIGESSSGMHF